MIEARGGQYWKQYHDNDIRTRNANDEEDEEKL